MIPLEEITLITYLPLLSCLSYVLRYFQVSLAHLALLSAQAFSGSTNGPHIIDWAEYDGGAPKPIHHQDGEIQNVMVSCLSSQYASEQVGKICALCSVFVRAKNHIRLRADAQLPTLRAENYGLQLPRPG